MTIAAEGVLHGRYSSLMSTRQVYLQRAIDCATLTIPSLVPPQGHSSASPLRTPYQALGARGVNNLAAKLLLTLLPPNARFFRLYISDILLEKLSGQEGLRAEIEEAFDRMERAVMGEIEGNNFRTSLFEALKQLIVAGNVLLYMLPQGGMKLFRLDRYVAKRDPAGNVLEIVTHEHISPMEVPAEIADAVKAKIAAKPANQHENTINVYTQIVREETRWTIRQEVCGVEVPGSIGHYPLDKSPWIALRFIAIDGEDFGRSYVEEYLGDLKSLEGLTKAIVQAAAAASKVLFLVKPNSTIKHSVLAQSESGAIREGNKDDVGVVQMEKYADFKVALETISKLETRLEFAFLLNTAIQRNAERVTAEEIRYMANELETALGGLYSTLGQELQLPLVTRVMFQMERKGQLPVLPTGMVKPTIVTGVEAMGRGNDLVNLKGFIEDLSVLGPEFIQQEVNVPDLVKRIGAARGIDMKGLIPTDAQRAQRQQQAQMQAAMQHLGPNAVNAMGGIAKERIKQQQGGGAQQAPAPQQ